MSWSALATTADQIKVREAEFFGDAADAVVIAMKQTLARDQIKRDIADDLGLPLDSTEFDTLAVDYASDLQRAMALLQLHLIFTDHDGGEGSVNRFKAEHYGALYAKERQRFKTFGQYATSARVGSVSRWL